MLERGSGCVLCRLYLGLCFVYVCISGDLFHLRFQNLFCSVSLRFFSFFSEPVVVEVMINDRTGALKAALNQNDGYEPCNDVNITIDNQESSMGEFFSEVEEVSQYLSKIESSVEEVKKKHSAVLCAPQSDEKVKQEIESLTAEIKRLANKVRSKLKLMEHGADIEKDKNATSASYRIKMTQHSTLSRRFVDIMFQYNKIQTDHRERCKDRIKRQLEITGKVTTDEEIENMLEKGDPAIFIEGIVIETQKAKQTLADIEARHADIMKLEKSIRELHDMFMDMAVLVESQGELINRIEHNVQNSVDYVDHAKGDINRAVKYQSKARRKKIIIAIVVLIILAVIGGIIWANVK